jgi:hypothetical protein
MMVGGFGVAGVPRYCVDATQEMELKPIDLCQIDLRRTLARTTAVEQQQDQKISWYWPRPIYSESCKKLVVMAAAHHHHHQQQQQQQQHQQSRNKNMSTIVAMLVTLWYLQKQRQQQCRITRRRRRP